SRSSARWSNASRYRESPHGEVSAKRTSNHGPHGGLMMPDTLNDLSKGALADLGRVFTALPDTAADGLIEAIVAAKKIVLFGLGREGLQMRGFAMRLFHMGRDVAVWADMTTPPVAKGDLLIVSAGPGDLAMAETLVKIAHAAGAKTALVTAQPGGG